MKKRKAFILGAGPTGLITGLRLLERGWDIEIYEKEECVGGLCRTWKWNNFLVDIGPHIYHTPDVKLAQFWEDKFGDLFVHDDFWCKNVKGDMFSKYWDYPLSWESISRYPKELKQKILKEFKYLSNEKMATAENYTEYIKAQVGETLYQMFFKKYPQKIWGLPTDEMTPDWAPKRIELRQKITPFYHNQWNAVGKYGSGCVFERIKEKIIQLGGIIYTNTEIKGLIYQNVDITGIEFINKESVFIKKDDVVISSLPLPILAGFLEYECLLSFRGLKIVHLAYNKKMVLPEGINWLYYDSDKVYFHRITEPKKLSSCLAPHDKTYLSAEIAISKGDKFDVMARNKLIQDVAEQIETVGLVKRSDVVDADVCTEYSVYPLQYAGYQEELTKVRSVISKFQQLHSLGTGGDFHYADIQIIFHKAFDIADILCGKDSAYTQVIRQTRRCSLNQRVNVKGRNIGQGERAYIIAEAGLNHNGSLKIAKEIIDHAKEIGCDAIKFQTFKPSSRVSRKIKTAHYAETIIGTEETIYDMFKRLAMSHKEQKELFSYANKKGIELFSTPFDPESADFLSSIGVNLFKIASMDIVNLPLIKHVARMNKPIILSTGMSTLGQIEEALEVIMQEGNPNVMLLHCNSSYPAAPEEMNLRVIKTLKESFKVPVGLSDHTIGLFVSQIALTFGADLIERHITLNRSMEGPDHILSSEPDEFRELVSISKRIPSILGNGIKRIQPNEYDTLNMQRKSLYAACLIKKGEVVTKEMIDIKGPGGGLLPKYMNIVVGRKARADIEQDYPITWENI